MKLSTLLAFLGSLIIGAGVATIVCPDVAEELWSHWFGYNQYSDFSSTSKAVGIVGAVIGGGIFILGLVRMLTRRL